MKYFLLFSLLFVSGTLFSQDITGVWYGYPDMKSVRLRLIFQIERTGKAYKTTLQIPDLSPEYYRATQSTFENNLLNITVPDADVICQGEFKPDGTIIGTITREGHVFALKLSREPVVFKRPQTPRPPFSYDSEDVGFSNTEAGLRLAGTLTFPRGGTNFPALVLISGSGPQNRDGQVFEHVPFRVIADYLTRRGIAVLRFDDRGTGASEGNFRESSIPEFETDVRAAIQFLKNRPEIRKDIIGVAGHSEGGFVAFSLAARKEVAFVITLAGGGINGRELLLQQRTALLKASGAKDEFITRYNEYIRQAQEIALQTADIRGCEERLDKLFMGTPLAGEAKAIANQLFNPGMLGLLKYDPEWDFPDISCPVLALNGEKDTQVPVENLQFILKGISANGNTNVTVKSYPGLNHMFQTADSGLPVEYSQIEETFHPDVLKDMAEWILGLSGK